MKTLLRLLLATVATTLLGIGGAAAQSGCTRVIQNGTSNNGNSIVWVAPCVISAAGGSAGSTIAGGLPMQTDLGVMGPFGILDAVTTGPYHQALFSYINGTFEINLSALGGATTQTRIPINIDGTQFYFPEIPQPVVNGDCLVGAGGVVVWSSSCGGSGSVSGLTAGQVGVAGSPTTLTSSVPFGTTGNQVLVQTSAGGLISNSLIAALPSSSMSAIITPGSCTDCSLTYDTAGRIVVAANGVGSGITGLTTAQIPIAGSATTLTSSIPVGLTGNSTVVETTSGGLLTASILPLATSSTFGAVEPDNVTVTISGGVITSTNGSGGISGLTTGQLGIAGSASTLTSSIPYGLTGNSTIVETTSGGLVTASLLPKATSSTFGAVEPDNSTITISSGVISSAMGGTGCTVSGGAGVLSNSGSSTCTTDTHATLSAGALSLGASGTAGSVVLGNATSGTVTVAPVTGALGSVTASLPANSGVVAELNLAQSWSAIQTFSSAPVISTITNTGTLTLPTTTGTLLETAGTNTVTGTLNVSGTFEIGGTTIVAEATPSAFGAVKPDNVTIVATSGVLSFNPAAAFGTPASSSASCTQGQSLFDASFAYFCTATNTWLRLANGATW